MYNGSGDFRYWPPMRSMLLIVFALVGCACLCAGQSPYSILAFYASEDPNASIQSLTHSGGQCEPWIGGLSRTISCSNGVATISMYTDPTCTTEVKTGDFQTNRNFVDVTSFLFETRVVGRVAVTCSADIEELDGVSETLPVLVNLYFGSCVNNTRSGAESAFSEVFMTNQTGVYSLVHDVLMSMPLTNGNYSWKTGTTQTPTQSVQPAGYLVVDGCAPHPAHPTNIVMTRTQNPYATFANRARLARVLYEPAPYPLTPLDKDQAGFISFYVLIGMCFIVTGLGHAFYIPTPTTSATTQGDAKLKKR